MFPKQERENRDSKCLVQKKSVLNWTMVIWHESFSTHKTSNTQKCRFKVFPRERQFTQWTWEALVYQSPPRSSVLMRSRMLSVFSWRFQPRICASLTVWELTSYTLHSFHHFPSTHLPNHVRSVSTRQKCDHEENLGKQEDSVYEPRIKTFHLPSQLRRRLLLHGRTELTWKIPKRYCVKTWPNKVQTSWKSTREKNHRRWWWKQTRSCHHELETLLRADSHPVRLW